MAIKRMTKKQIDTNILEYLLLDEAIKKLQQEKKVIQNALEAQYKEEDKIREFLHGATTEAEKIPVNGGANKYDAEKVKIYTDAAGVTKRVITTITVDVVNVAEFKKCAKEGLFPESTLEKCRQDSWTFKSAFRRKEAKTQTKNDAAGAVDAVIDRVKKNVAAIQAENVDQPKKAKAKKAVGQ